MSNRISDPFDAITYAMQTLRPTRLPPDLFMSPRMAAEVRAAARATFPLIVGADFGREPSFASLAFGGMTIIETPHAYEVVEDWSDCRSPSRARRRRAQGHRQRVKRVKRDLILAFDFSAIEARVLDLLEREFHAYVYKKPAAS